MSTNPTSGAMRKSDGGDHRHADRQGCSKRGSWLDPSAYDAGKKIKGRKRRILVDTLGLLLLLLLNVVVHPVDVQDSDGAFHLLRRAPTAPAHPAHFRRWRICRRQDGARRVAHRSMEVGNREAIPSCRIRSLAQAMDRRKDIRLDHQ